jgi:hypothetical protein
MGRPPPPPPRRRQDGRCRLGYRSTARRSSADRHRRPVSTLTSACRSPSRPWARGVGGLRWDSSVAAGRGRPRRSRPPACRACASSTGIAAWRSASVRAAASSRTSRSARTACTSTSGRRGRAPAARCPSWCSSMAAATAAAGPTNRTTTVTSSRPRARWWSRSPTGSVCSGSSPIPDSRVSASQPISVCTTNSRRCVGCSATSPLSAAIRAG